MLTDKEIISQVVSRDTQMFSLLVDRYKDKIFNLIYRMTGDYAEAQDLSQEVFIKVYKNLDRFYGECKVSTWIYRIASNISIDWYRKKKRKKCVMMFEDGTVEQMQDHTPLPQEIIINMEEQKKVKRAVNKLKDKYRTVIIMYYYQNLSCKDIADILKLPVRTVETRVYRAKKQLKKYLTIENTGGELHEAQK